MNTSKNIFILFSFVLSSLCYSQFGINTNTPRARLDIQGNLSVRNLVRLGGTDAVNGDLGNSGTVLVSRGAGLAPVWKLIRRPNFNPFYYTIFNNAGIETQAGVILAGTTLGGNEVHAENQTFAAYGGSEIAGLQKVFDIDNANNVAVFTFETIAHSSSTTANNAVDFSCGIFVDNQLKGLRIYTLSQTGGSTPFYTFDLIASTSGLSVGTHTARVACKRRANVNSFAGNLGIGKAVAGNLNDFMTKSSLVIQTYEKPPTTNTVTVYNP